MALKKTAYLPVRMSPEIKKRLKDVAKAKERTASWLAHKYIEDGIARDEKKLNKAKGKKK